MIHVQSFGSTQPTAIAWVRQTACILGLVLMFVCQSTAVGQAVPDNLQFGLGVPPDVEQITTKALKHLVDTQEPNGTWLGGYDTHAPGRENTAIAGMAMMAMLSTGEDPNVGPYSASIRKALQYLISTQNPETGFLPNTMYNHGFAMLALSEAYGVIDDDLLWENADDVAPERQRTIGEALKLAVSLAVKSQAQNPSKAWRYTPTTKSADTSVSGAVLVGLLAARNAGVAVPDVCLEQGLAYIEGMTNSKNGYTLYDNVNTGAEGSSLSCISALTLSIGNRRDTESTSAASKRIRQFVDLTDSRFPYYNMYYMAQALFQTDYDSWDRWNKITIRRLRRQQASDGSFESQFGKAYGTSMACLSLALNYRFLPIYER